MGHLAEAFGKLHPVLLHFPLALLVVAAAAEIVRSARDSEFLTRFVVWLLAIGAVTSVLASGSGWLLAAHEHIRSDQKTTLGWHRWLGLATAGISGLGWVVAVQPCTGWWKRVRHVVVITAGALVVATGYFGGELVWGRDWFQFSKESANANS